MNIALFVDQSFRDYQEKLPLDRFCKVFRSIHTIKSMAMMEVALDLDRAIFLDGCDIDYVLYANNPDINWDKFVQLTTYEGSFYNTIWYTNHPEDSNALALMQSVNSNFYCSPKVLTCLGSAYKLAGDLEPITNFKLNCKGGDDHEFITHRYMLERLNIKSLMLP